jgi:hypothetical protein
MLQNKFAYSSSTSTSANYSFVAVLMSHYLNYRRFDEYVSRWETIDHTHHRYELQETIASIGVTYHREFVYKLERSNFVRMLTT